MLEVRIVSDTLAKAVSLQIRGTKATFSDNCSEMAPGIERKIGATLDKLAKTGDLLKRMQLLARAAKTDAAKRISFGSVTARLSTR